MSLIAKIQAKQSASTKPMFCVVAGPRLAGKTTIAGTLEGKTLLIQAEVLESGCESAKALAAQLGNELHVTSFTGTKDLKELIAELVDDEYYDNIVLDSVTAVTEMIYSRDDNVRMRLKNVWDGFRVIADETRTTLHSLKGLTYPAKAKKPKNVFVTIALETKHDSAGNVNEVTLVAKGNVAVSEITKLGEAVFTVLPPVLDEEGKASGHRLLTKSLGFFPGRIDGLLADQNPGQIEPASLATVLNLLNKGAKANGK